MSLNYYFEKEFSDFGINTVPRVIQGISVS